MKFRSADLTKLTEGNPISDIKGLAYVGAIDEPGLKLLAEKKHGTVDQILVGENTLDGVETLDWRELLEVELVAASREDMLHLDAMNKRITGRVEVALYG